MGLAMSFDKTAIRLADVSKQYLRYRHPAQRLLQTLWPSHRDAASVFTALAPLSLEIDRGEAIGIVGRNGAGKSTLLQLICGTLAPSSGCVTVNGSIGALLELGAGFNPEFSGRENIFLAASVMGLDHTQIESLYDEIVDFSGIAPFITQPVKTYSSGMYVRLAFSIATCVRPDILVIDEALSVGDGAFARKSFDRIMRLREQGSTILFCSHSLYQVEAFCDRALWLDQGRVRLDGPTASVVAAYNNTLRAGEADTTPAPRHVARGPAFIRGIEVEVDGVIGSTLSARSQESDVTIRVAFASDPEMPCPVVATGFALPDGQIFSSVYTLFDQVVIERNAAGEGVACVTFAQIPLMKGRYSIGAYLFCERAIHVYDRVLDAVTLDVTQSGVEQGFVHLPHTWVKRCPSAC